MLIKYFFWGTLLFFTGAARAEIILNGFASFYGRESLTEARQPTLNGQHLDFTDTTRIGLNLRSDFSKELAVVGQLVADKHSSTNEAIEWSPEFDWFFLSYSPLDQLIIKIGRQLFPGSIIGEYVDVGITYPWRALPWQYRFSVQFKSFEGVSGAYSWHVGEKVLTLKTFGGSSRPSITPYSTIEFDIRGISGLLGQMSWGSLTIQGLASQYKFIGRDPTTETEVIDSASPSLLTSVGMRFDDGERLAYAEYADIECGAKNEVCSLYSYYATVGHYFDKWLPHYTYSNGSFQITAPAIPSIGLPQKMQSHAFGLNYQVNSSLVVKSEFVLQKGEGDGTLFLTEPGTARSYALGFDLVF